MNVTADATSYGISLLTSTIQMGFVMKNIRRLMTILIMTCLSVTALGNTCLPAADRLRNLSTNPVPPFTDFNAPLGDAGCASDNCVEYILTACDGTKIRVQEWKNSQKKLNTQAKPIVMIHGFPHSHLLYTRQVNSFLADKYRMITYDVRGQASSDKPTDIFTAYQNKNYADDLKDVIDSLQLVKPVIVAHSYGGTIPVDYADFYGVKNISGLVLVGAFMRLDFDGSGGKEPTINEQVFVDNGPDLIPGLFSANLGNFIHQSKRFVDLSVNRKIAEAKDILAYDTMTPVIVRSGTFLARDVPMSDPFRNDIFTDVLSQIPTFVIHSQFDHLIKYQHALDNYQLLNARHHASLWLIENKTIGHMPQLEIPDRFNEQLEQFIDKQCK
jgi:pimeloyl-ACP methyl ester carboxylesterase